MAKQAMIRARIEPELKTQVEDIFEELGLSVTEAITLFYKQVKLNSGLPFEVRIPNATTLKTFQDTDSGRNLVRSKNARELFKKGDLQAKR
jgi:DNA-damage-inducible protein J